ncbi:hypothetical protein [Corynebacterium stationis]|uniref:hypothetical protein n=1 Tax=Corynebacterium stationis TaxID=1705 RepID=UPI00263142C0|nr:hypothetical protein [Corynebacterium stationis]
MLSRFYHSPIENLTDNAHPFSVWQAAKDPDQPCFWVFHIGSPGDRTAFTIEQFNVFLDVLEISLCDADEPIPYLPA